MSSIAPVEGSGAAVGSPAGTEVKAGGGDPGQQRRLDDPCERVHRGDLVKAAEGNDRRVAIKPREMDGVDVVSCAVRHVQEAIGTTLYFAARAISDCA
jgi:hypothetical protein